MWFFVLRYLFSAMATSACTWGHVFLVMVSCTPPNISFPLLDELAASGRGLTHPNEMSEGAPAVAVVAAASAPVHEGSREEESTGDVEVVQNDAASGGKTGKEEEGQHQQQQQRHSQRQKSEEQSRPRQQHKQQRRQQQRRPQKLQHQHQQQSSALLPHRSTSPSAKDDAIRTGCSPSDTHVHLDMPPPNPPSSGPKVAQRGSVQRLLEEEGHDARNVVSWLVPNLTNGTGGGGGSSGGVIVDAHGEAVRGGGGAVGRSWGAQQHQQQQQSRGWRGERPSREGSREREHGR